MGGHAMSLLIEMPVTFEMANARQHPSSLKWPMPDNIYHLSRANIHLSRVLRMHKQKHKDRHHAIYIVKLELFPNEQQRLFHL
jgi:hypothetical protein